MWVWARSEGEDEGESEDRSDCPGETDPLRHRDILIHTHTHTHILTHPAQKYHHSTQDQILHPSQPTRQPAQFHERISARITVKSFLKIVVFCLKTLLFLR